MQQLSPMGLASPPIQPASRSSKRLAPHHFNQASDADAYSTIYIIMNYCTTQSGHEEPVNSNTIPLLGKPHLSTSSSPRKFPLFGSPQQSLNLDWSSPLLSRMHAKAGAWPGPGLPRPILLRSASGSWRSRSTEGRRARPDRALPARRGFEDDHHLLSTTADCDAGHHPSNHGS